MTDPNKNPESNTGTSYVYNPDGTVIVTEGIKEDIHNLIEGNSELDAAGNLKNISLKIGELLKKIKIKEDIEINIELIELLNEEGKKLKILLKKTDVNLVDGIIDNLREEHNIPKKILKKTVKKRKTKEKKQGSLNKLPKRKINSTTKIPEIKVDESINFHVSQAEIDEMNRKNNFEDTIRPVKNSSENKKLSEYLNKFKGAKH